VTPLRRLRRHLPPQTGGGDSCLPPLKAPSEARAGEGGAQRRKGVAALLVALLLSLPALAVEPSEMLKDPALEARAREIGRALRCVVCQNQSIDDSAAEVAHDMRRAVRERLVAGDTDAQVMDFMVARYGDYVLLKPPFKADTWLLWLGGPLVLLLAGAGLVLAARRRRTVEPTPAPLTDEERARLSVILSEAKDPMPSPSGDEVLPFDGAQGRRSAQDDKRA
jgi:cytochrome c-type biogenesis protein CcmH